MSSFTALEQHFQTLAKYQHLEAICSWDQSAIMPAGGSQARSEAMAELALLIHNHISAPQLADWFTNADSEPLQPEQKVSLQAMHKQWQQTVILPGKLVEAKSLATAKCEQAWRTQRPNNDWQGFATNLKEVVSLAREEATIRASANNGSRYEALLELFEPGATTKALDDVFGRVKTWLPNLINEVIEHQAAQTVIQPQGPFPIALQKQLGEQVMTLLGFDFNHGRLDVSTHPFCGGVPTDVRLTTRYDEHNFMSALLGVIHETGHARYEQNLPKAFMGLPVGKARSMGIHESQSLFFEMQLARGQEFSELLAPLVANVFNQPNAEPFSAQNLYRCNTRVKKDYIRVNADEVTYPAHIILRYEIEQALIEGHIEVAHIPELWAEKMQNYLGLNTTDNYRDGCMQDIHWPLGLFGYFPSYTLGAMYAAQQFHAAQQSIGNLHQKIAEGNLSELFEWLNSNIWQKASTLSTDELIQQATGETLNPDHFHNHLRKRYLEAGLD